MSSVPLLEVANVNKRFGGLKALQDVNLSLETGKLHAIIGPNGAGKTTLFNVITGTIPVTSGRIKFLGADMTNDKVHRISKRGLARTLQIKSVFANMTVRENLWIAAQSHHGVFSPFKNWKKCVRSVEMADIICEQIGLTSLADQTASNLSHGDIALLEMGLALATQPKLLLLDEPICGMGPAETEQTVIKIQEISKSTAIIIIEHDIEVVFKIADEITVMANGAVLAKGTPEFIAANSDVRNAYLGDDDDD